jgi:hypothetical protein
LKLPWWVKKILWVLLLILVISPSKIASGQNLSPDQEYQSTIEKIKKGEDTETDYTKLRMLYTQTSFYQPESPERDENILKMAQAWFDKHNDEAIELGNQLLEGEYLNPFVHDLFAKIYKESGEGDPLFHLLMFINIITSIQGDGKSYETAYKVISTWEEKAMMTFVQVTPADQDQVFEPNLHDGHYFHVIQVKADETGEISDLYFNIDIPYQKAQQTGPIMTTPVIIPPPPTPALQPITTYTDPIGCLKASYHGTNFHASLVSFISLKKHRLAQHLALFLGQILTEKTQSSDSVPTENIESPLAGSLVFNNIWPLPSFTRSSRK